MLIVIITTLIEFIIQPLFFVTTSKFSSTFCDLIGCRVPTWQQLIGSFAQELVLLSKALSAGNGAWLKGNSGVLKPV